MKTTNLVTFQYVNATTTYHVMATEYEGLSTPTPEFRVTVIDGETATTTAPATHTEAVQLAEASIAEFLRRMVPIYL